MQSVREVYSLLMPIKDGRVVVPRAAVAEVMGYTRPRERPEGAPEFVLGFVDWQGQKIPLVSFEAARGQAVPELGRRTRIAVVFGIAGRLKPDVFAIVTQGYPYLVRINENVLQHEPMESEDPMILARIRMANEKPYIPDLEALEIRIAAGLGISEEPVAEAQQAEVDELDALASGEEEFEAGFLNNDQVGDLQEDTERPGIDTVVEQGAQDVAEVPEVTAFGETDYSMELGELSVALDGDDHKLEVETDTPVPEDSDPSEEIILSGITFETDDESDQAEDFEIDLSEFDIDLDDEDEKKSD